MILVAEKFCQSPDFSAIVLCFLQQECLKRAAALAPGLELAAHADDLRMDINCFDLVYLMSGGDHNLTSFGSNLADFYDDLMDYADCVRLCYKGQEIKNVRTDQPVCSVQHPGRSC